MRSNTQRNTTRGNYSRVTVCGDRAPDTVRTRTEVELIVRDGTSEHREPQGDDDDERPLDLARPEERWRPYGNQ